MLTVKAIAGSLAAGCAGLPMFLFLAECLNALIFPFHGTALAFMFEALFAALGMSALKRFANASQERWGEGAKSLVLIVTFCIGLLLWAIASSRQST